ncbi:transporter [Alphaproteobacteria bacterium]|nr:transporter [Alphaproteobacteria bacterium]
MFFALAIAVGVFSGFSGISVLEQLGNFCSKAFMRIFRFISTPVVSLSVIIALSSYGAEKSMSSIWKKTFFYTITTTILAASVSAILYCIIKPGNMSLEHSPKASPVFVKTDYAKYIIDIIPDSFFSAFAEHKVLSVLIISVILGIAIRLIKEEKEQSIVVSFFNGIHSIFLVITQFIIKILPIGLFGFITVSIMELKTSMDLKGMGGYFSIVVLSNIIQGVIILPIFLSLKKINPLKTFKAMSSALSVAFFSKSSSGTLPITISVAEEKLGIRKEISRFVLPLCTSINMNGCAAFIFTTVIYIMQNYGIEISVSTIISWIIIATIAAIGNAGIPMGCFMLSASLLSSMDIPMPLLGVILPIYGVIDMLETSLNVWSDSVVVCMVNKEVS